MRRIIAAFLFCSIGTIVNAKGFEIEKKLICGPRLDILKELASADWQEFPVWVGVDPDSKTNYSLFVNKTTGTWTMLEFNGKVACAVGFGTRSMMLDSANKARIQS